MDLNKFKPRERLLILIAGGLVPFLVFWYLVLNPALLVIDRTYNDIQIYRLGLESSRLARAIKGISQPRFYQREEQLRRIVDFLESAFKEQGISLLNLKQSSQDQSLFIDVSFLTTYGKFISFLDLLRKSELVLIVDEVALDQSGSDLNVKMKLLSSHI